MVAPRDQLFAPCRRLFDGNVSVYFLPFLSLFLPGSDPTPASWSACPSVCPSVCRSSSLPLCPHPRLSALFFGRSFPAPHAPPPLSPPSLPSSAPPPLLPPSLPFISPPPFCAAHSLAQPRLRFVPQTHTTLLRLLLENRGHLSYSPWSRVVASSSSLGLLPDPARTLP